MVDAPDLRAGDEDRDRTITLIREAYAEGRLDTEEFQFRMTTAQQSRTYGELAALVSDLPVAAPVAPVPSAASVPSTAAQPSAVVAEHADLRKGWASWIGVSVLVNVIWAASWMSEGGSPPYYWPIWVMGPWGAAMLVTTISRRGRRSEG
jgi:hypothetical protein